MYDKIYLHELSNGIRLNGVSEYYNETIDIIEIGILVYIGPGEVMNVLCGLRVTCGYILCGSG